MSTNRWPACTGVFRAKEKFRGREPARTKGEKERRPPLRLSCSSARSVKTNFKTSNYQRLRNAAENDWRFIRSYSNDVHKFHVKDGLSPGRVIKLRVLEGPNTRSMRPIHSKWKSKRSWLHMCRACVIATWRLGLRAPLVARNQTAPATQARTKQK